MPKINLLDKHVAELIAAGEVIERPASVVKELLENAVDAGADLITVEIRNGGKYIRVSDNGCGIAPEDISTAFKRHATSKVLGVEDLEHISTLGFRGEALASICAVSKVEVVSKPATNEFGTSFSIQGGENEELAQTGCPDGTTITVRDLFYNVPARLKFLKKDVSESNAVQSITEKIALSHPDISFKLIRDQNLVLHTPGNNDLYSVIYAIFGREFASGLLKVDYAYNGVDVSGYVSAPAKSRANRSMQHFFVNGRYVKPKTCMVALEEAYKNSIMSGKYPACVLNLSLNFETVDVNVHPAKIEVRFVNEKAVFDCVYFAVKSALAAGGTGYETKPAENRTLYAKDLFNSEENFVQVSIDRDTGEVSFAAAGQEGLPEAGAEEKKIADNNWLFAENKDIPKVGRANEAMLMKDSVTPFLQPIDPRHFYESFEKDTKEPPADPIENPVRKSAGKASAEPVRLIGELFKTYILLEQGNSFVVIDKHAAHERILYEQIKESAGVFHGQLLLSPLCATLSREEHFLVLSKSEIFRQFGFAVEDFGAATVLIREIPSMLDEKTSLESFHEILNNLSNLKQDLSPDVLDSLYKSIACKGAIKGRQDNDAFELEELARRVLGDERIRYCPHGRPLILRFSREKFEKQFGR